MHLAPYKNFVLILFSRLFDFSITLALLSGLARLTGSEILGIYYFARSVATLTATISEIGLSRLTIKLLAEDRNLYPSLFGKLIVLRIFLSLIALLVLFSILYSVEISPDITEASMIFALGLLFFQIADLYLDVLRARETMLIPVLFNVLQRTAYVGFALLGLALGYHLNWVLTIFVITNLLHLVVSAALIQTKFGHYDIRSNATIDSFRKLISDAGSFTMVVLLGAISGKIGVLLLYNFHDETAVGFYGAAIHIVEALFYVAYAITSVAFPNLVRLYSSGRPEFINGVKAVTKALLLFIVPVAYLILVSSEALIYLVYGPEYHSSVLILQITVAMVVPGFINAFLLTLLLATGHQRLAAILMLPFIFIQGVAGLFLIPNYEGAGAAIAYAGAEVCHFFLLAFAVNKIVRIRELSSGLWKILFAFCVMVLISIIPTPFNDFIKMVAGTFAFLALIVFLKPFSHDEIVWVGSSLVVSSDQVRHSQDQQD